MVYMWWIWLPQSSQRCYFLKVGICIFFLFFFNLFFLNNCWHWTLKRQSCAAKSTSRFSKIFTIIFFFNFSLFSAVPVDFFQNLDTFCVSSGLHRMELKTQPLMNEMQPLYVRRHSSPTKTNFPSMVSCEGKNIKTFYWMIYSFFVNSRITEFVTFWNLTTNKDAVFSVKKGNKLNKNHSSF